MAAVRNSGVVTHKFNIVMYSL